MQQTFLTEIRRRVPDAELEISSPFPERDGPYYWPVPVRRSRRRNLPVATMHLAVLAFMRMLGYQPRRYPPDEEINAMIAADAIVDLSGDMLTEDYGILVGYSHLLPLLQAHVLGRPVIVCAQSIGPFRWLSGLARYVLMKAHLVTLRESRSMDIINSLAGKAINASLTADLAFLMQSSSDERVNAILIAEGVPKRSRPRLGVTVSALLANSRKFRTSEHGRSLIMVIASTLDLIVERLNVDILLVPHVFGPRGNADDRAAANKLASAMKHTPLCIRYEYRPDELKGIIAHCDAFVGCRMHANIAALDSNVPVLAIGYSHKTVGILADMGLSEWAYPVDEIQPDLLFNAIAELLTKANMYRHVLSQRLPEVRARAEANIEKVISVIQANRDVGREGHG